jgi:hypothetical protein
MEELVLIQTVWLVSRKSTQWKKYKEKDKKMEDEWLPVCVPYDIYKCEIFLRY